MMKQLCTRILLTMLVSMVGTSAFAYDIAVENADGVTIYYNYSSDRTGLIVTNLEGGCYSGSVVIPEEVTYMNRTRKVTSIGDWAFSRCTSLTSVTIPNSVTTIGYSAFWECHSLTSVTIPNSLTSICDDTFSGCHSLTSVTIPNSVTSIGGGAFSYCYSLTSITIPNSVTSIGGGAFSHCSSLTSVIIPNSLTSIGQWAFSTCSSLTTVTIPNSVTSIGYGAFNETDLTCVVSLIDRPFDIFGVDSYNGHIGNSEIVGYYGTFSKNTFNNATLYVPVGTIEKYKATKGWKDFFFIEEGMGPNGNSIANVRANPMLIQSDGTTLTISGAEAGTAISVYDTSGRMVGSTLASSGTTTIDTSLRRGEICILKIGEKSVKILMK